MWLYRPAANSHTLSQNWHTFPAGICGWLSCHLPVNLWLCAPNSLRLHVSPFVHHCRAFEFITMHFQDNDDGMTYVSLLAKFDFSGMIRWSHKYNSTNTIYQSCNLISLLTDQISLSNRHCSIITNEYLKWYQVANIFLFVSD